MNTSRMDIPGVSLIRRYSEVAPLLDSIIREQLVAEGIPHSVKTPPNNISKENVGKQTITSLKGSCGVQRDCRRYTCTNSTENKSNMCNSMEINSNNGAASKIATTADDTDQKSHDQVTSSIESPLKRYRRTLPYEKAETRSRPDHENKRQSVPIEGSKSQRCSEALQKNTTGKEKNVPNVCREKPLHILRTRRTVQSGVGIETNNETCARIETEACIDPFSEHFKVRSGTALSIAPSNESTSQTSSFTPPQAYMDLSHSVKPPTSSVTSLHTLTTSLSSPCLSSKSASSTPLVSPSSSSPMSLSSRSLAYSWSSPYLLSSPTQSSPSSLSSVWSSQLMSSSLYSMSDSKQSSLSSLPYPRENVNVGEEIIQKIGPDKMHAEQLQKNSNNAEHLPIDRNNVEQFPSKWNNVEQFPSKWNNVEQFPSKWNNAEHFPSKWNNVEQFPSNLKNMGQFSSNWKNTEQFPSNWNNVQQLQSNRKNFAELQSGQTNAEQLPCSLSDAGQFPNNKKHAQQRPNNRNDAGHLSYNRKNVSELQSQPYAEQLPSSSKNVEQLPCNGQNAEQLPSNLNSAKVRPVEVGYVDEDEMLFIVETLVKAQNCFAQFPSQEEQLKEFQQKQSQFLEKKPCGKQLTESAVVDTDVDSTRKLLMETVVQYIEQKIVETVRFAKQIPGFCGIPRDDQAALIKESRIESDLISGMRGVNTSNMVFFSSHDGHHFSIEDMKTVFPQETIEMFIEGGRKVAKINATIEEAAVLRAMTLTFSDRCQLQCREKVEDIQNRLVSCLLYVVKKRPVSLGIRMGQLFEFLVFCRNITDVELKTTKTILLETEKYSSNPIINEVL